MADMFISYAKADRELVVRLAALLEAHGYTTWWDTSLLTGDDFRKVIMQELGKARACIVIWTPNSINSDWVRSEAGRAQADRKLIPVKLPSLTYKDIPPPFDVLHTENLDAEENILAGVVAQLAKPEVQPTTLAVLSKSARYQFLTYFGILGGAVTLFTNARSLIDLAEWAQRLITQWHKITHAFWSTVFERIGFKVPSEWYPLLSFGVFCLSLACAARMRATSAEMAIGFPNVPWFKWRVDIRFSALFMLGIMLAVFFLYEVFDWQSRSEPLWYTLLFVGAVLLWTLYDEIPAQKRGFIGMVLLLSGFWSLLVLIPWLTQIGTRNRDALAYSLAAIPLLIVGVRFIAPLTTVNRRLVAMVATLILLIGLNYASIAAREIIARVSYNG